jgi:hypothetical protein
MLYNYSKNLKFLRVKGERITITTLMSELEHNQYSASK